MPNLPAIHNFRIGDTLPPAAPADYAGLFFLNGVPMLRRPGLPVVELVARPRWVVALALAGEATDEQLFGWHKPSEAVTVTHLELEAQEAPVGGVLQVELVDASGASFAPPRTVTIADGAFHAVADIADLAVASGATLRARVKSVGATAPGGYLTLRLSITTQ